MDDIFKQIRNIFFVSLILFKYRIRMNENEIEGLKKLATGTLILVMVGMIILLILFQYLFIHKTPSYKELGFVGIIVSSLLLFSYSYLDHGFYILVTIGKYTREGISASSKLTGSLILFIISIILLEVSHNEFTGNTAYLLFIVSLFLLLIGLILQLIGNIELGITFRRFNEIYAEKLVRYGGSLLLIAMILSIIIFPTFILFNKYYEQEIHLIHLTLLLPSLLLLPFVLYWISFIILYKGLRKIIAQIQ